MKVIIPSNYKVGPYIQNTVSCLYNSHPGSITILEGEGTGTYKVCEGLATSKCKEIADAMGVEYKSSWFTHKIAQEVLMKALGDSYKNPKRGVKQTVWNLAIFDGYILLHEYCNDGYGFQDSIKKGCWVYKRQ